jgi:hypothetical protein
MIFWTGLHKADFQEKLKESIGVLLSVACQVMTIPRSSPPRLLLAVDGDAEEDDNAGCNPKHPWHM